MKISIDMENMSIMHKHSNSKVVCHLAYIECRHGGYRITDINAKSFLSDFTDMEMRMLYKNLVGSENYFKGASLRAIIADIIDRMPETDVNPYEAEVQANLIAEDDRRPFKYVKGAMKPTIVEGLFTKASGTKNDNEPLAAAKGRARYYDGLIPASALVYSAPKQTPATPLAVRVTPAPAAVQRPAAQPRQGGVKEIIWREADNLWNKIGSPKDIPSLLKLRKEIMEYLEKNFGVKRNTSSNELGNWQRAKITA